MYYGMRYYVFLLLTLLIIAIANAGVLEDGIDANKSNNYQRAFDLLQPLAEQGNAYAQIEIGMMYYMGHGIAKDYVKATEWWRKAAEQGNASGQSNLGNMYYMGYGVARDYVKAAQWWHKAAEQGDTGGQLSIGYMYYEGKSVARDYVKATEWWRKAAEQGNATAKRHLEMMEGQLLRPESREASSL